VVGVEQLEKMPTDWTRALAIAAHPDDLEYGAAMADARGFLEFLADMTSNAFGGVRATGFELIRM
jgi:hypothetical protein